MEDGIEQRRVSELRPESNEVPLEAELPGLMPELDHGHAHHGHASGIRWLDAIVGISVIFISMVSLVVSIEHGRTMQKMVDQNQNMVDQNQKLVVANTLPILRIMGRELDDSGKPMVQVTLSNSGVGPALIDRFEIRYKGAVYTELSALLRACCGEAYLKSKKSQRQQVFYSNVSGFILPARQDFSPVTIKPDKDGLELYNAFDRIRQSDDLIFHACYCSVLNECWETNFDRKRPQPVTECKVAPGEKLW